MGDGPYPRRRPAIGTGIGPHGNVPFVEPIGHFRVGFATVESPEPFLVDRLGVRVLPPIHVPFRSRGLDVPEDRERGATPIEESGPMRPFDPVGGVPVGTLVMPGAKERAILPAIFLGIDMIIDRDDTHGMIDTDLAKHVDLKPAGDSPQVLGDDEVTASVLDQFDQFQVFLSVEIFTTSRTC